MKTVKPHSKATIFVSGFFHLPIVTQALSASFNKIDVHSSYPNFYLRSRLSPTVNHHSHTLKEIAGRLPYWMFHDRSYQLSKIFQRSIRHYLDELNSDVVIGWAGHSLSVVEECTSKNIPFVLERGSTHIRWQRDRLRLAYKNAGLPENLKEIPSERFIENQEQEYKLADRIHVPTLSCRRSFEKYLGKKASQKLRLTRYGFNFPTPTQREENTVSPKLVRCLFVGTLSVRKGFFDYCSISRKLSDTTASFSAVGKFDNDTSKVIEKFEPNCHIKKSQSKAELFNIYQTHDILVVCSYEEGLSMVIPEAMSQGMVVIGTIDSGADEYVTDGVNGIILEAGNVDEFVSALLAILKDPDILGYLKSNMDANSAGNDFDNYSNQVNLSIGELLS
jgi:glycosyltransferase involved in cell wall biosynthesis